MNFKSLSLAVVACTAVVFAQSAPATTPATAPAGKKVAVHAPAAKELMAHGIIESTDLISNQMVIKGDKASLTIDVAPTTTITIGKTKATLGDLKAEMSVMVSYKVEDGKNVASKIIEKAVTVKPKVQKK